MAVPCDDLEEKVNDEIKLWHFFQDVLASSGEEVGQQRTDEFHTSNILGTDHACHRHHDDIST